MKLERGSMFDWGNNCRLLRLSVPQAEKELDQWLDNMDSWDYDDFWDGYWNGSNTQLTQILPKGV